MRKDHIDVGRKGTRAAGAERSPRDVVMYVAVAAKAKASIPLGGHLWYVVTAFAFIVISLGGVWLSEVWQRRRKVAGVAGHGPMPWLASPVGGSAVAASDFVGSVEPGSRGGVSQRSVLLPLVGLGSVAAASVHFVVMPQHFKEATIYGAFFATAATLQVAFALLVLARPSRPLIAVGFVGNLSVIILWLITRTVAIPLGPAAGSTEAVGGLDILRHRLREHHRGLLSHTSLAQARAASGLAAHVVGPTLMADGSGRRSSSRSDDSGGAPQLIEAGACVWNIEWGRLFISDRSMHRAMFMTFARLSCSG